MSGPSAVHSLATPDDEPRKARKHKTSIRVAALNITSMMDLVLNLLLFFVLSSSFALTEGSMPATLPTGGPGEGPGAPVAEELKAPKDPIIISLHKLGSDRALIQIEGTNKAVQNSDELFKMLEQYHADGIYMLDNPITIKPDSSATWNQVVDTFNAVIRARYTSVGFAPAAG